jgi:hypothetical protein
VTFGSGGQRSIQLSYERARTFGWRPGGAREREANKPSSVPLARGGSFLWERRCRCPRAAYPGLWRSGQLLVPYLALLRVGFTMPLLSPGARCALTAPFHPCLCPRAPAIGGLLSVALSVAFRRPGVTRHPALWSSDFPRPGVPAPRSNSPDPILTRLPFVKQCPGEDSNLHAVSGTRSLVWPVYQFQHLGIPTESCDIWEAKRASGTQLITIDSVLPRGLEPPRACAH